jgi:hypothetical protein
MSERCSNCGAELFAGQQFCRACGASVRAGGEEAPTQLFPAPGESPTTTSRLDPRGTDPVRDPRPTGYQPPTYQAAPPAPFGRTAPLGAAPPSRGRGGWIVAIVAVAVVSILGTLAVVFFLRARHPERIVVRQSHGAGEGVPAPPIPPDLPERVREAIAATGAPLPIDEADAEVSSDETEFTKTYDLDARATFSLKNFNGPVRIEGWDEAQAEVRVVKRGGTPEQRRGVPVLAQRREGSLALTSVGRPGGHVSVSYEIKLPRTLKQVEVAAETSEVSVEGLAGTVVVDVKAGRLEFKDVTGVVRSNIIKGHTRVEYEDAHREGPQEFRANLGDVEVSFPEGFNADLKAETIDGRIEVDGDLGLQVVTAAAGRHVVGRLGEGREPLLIRVVNGDIKLKR